MRSSTGLRCNFSRGRNGHRRLGIASAEAGLPSYFGSAARPADVNTGDRIAPPAEDDRRDAPSRREVGQQAKLACNLLGGYGYGERDRDGER